MDPVAFEIYGIAIRWYGILLSAGILAGILLAYNEAKRLGYDPEYIIDLALWCVPMAVIGARLYYVIFEWDYYKGDILKMINIREGGLAIHGALIAAVLTGYIFTRARKISFWETADIVAPSIIIGQAIGRWGNFMNAEAHGGPTDLPWGIMVDGVKVHPTFLYESLWNFGVFIVLILYRRKKKVDGEVFLLYGILYSVGRFWIEGLRTDSLMFMGMRTAQLISVAIIVAFAALMVYRRKNRKPEIEEQAVKETEAVEEVKAEEEKE
ncbi:MAG TPA: prolipoprotein diacylglyceryl transferase [Clostridia bacterium]|nr:prolipoprotein diacylglyceryl transferase [Clostridia bacterium]